jgi:hypothetical protein
MLATYVPASVNAEMLATYRKEYVVVFDAPLPVANTAEVVAVAL